MSELQTAMLLGTVCVLLAYWLGLYVGRLIARHLKAHGEDTGYNAGTPLADEACNVSGLREQLRRLDDPASSVRSGGGLVERRCDDGN